MSPSPRVAELIDQLHLLPHPERGFYVETYRATTAVDAKSHGGERSASTAIYFLVTADQPVTSLHRLKSDEVFHLYEGGPLDVVRLFADGRSDAARLGVESRGRRASASRRSGWDLVWDDARAWRVALSRRLHGGAGFRVRGLRLGRRPRARSEVPDGSRMDSANAPDVESLTAT